MERSQATTDDYFTPRWVFDRLGIRFDLDVCAPPGGVDWVPTERFYTLADDGLMREWSGRVWMNPPFSNTTPWVNRFISHGNGIALVPTAKAQWFGKLWEAADGIAMPGRIDFVSEVGTGEIMFTLCLAAFGEACVHALQNFGRVRV
jgi:phage N-6-adenine-methyltransferase